MSNELINVIRRQSLEIFPRIQQIRRELHAHPELSFQEIETSRRICQFLAEEGISYTGGWAGHGIVATIAGTQEGPEVMLRADMDALPITEKTNLEYKSVTQGLMHACGHDVHTAIVMGVACLLMKNKDRLRGKVRIIFQPGEEKLPGGASMMIREGLFKESRPDYILAQHVFPSLPAGHVGFRSGQYMASADEFYITVNGKGGHAATPHQCIDPIVIASRIVLSLQELVSRKINPVSPAVLSIGRMNSEGGATNVIPDVVRLEGTLRMMDETERFEMHDRIQKMVYHICEASGAGADVSIQKGYPCLTNDPATTEMCRQYAVEYLGAGYVHDLPIRMTSEDFAFYTQEVPGTFYRVGTGFGDASKDFPVHSSYFHVNEDSLKTGIGLMTYMTLSTLR